MTLRIITWNVAGRKKTLAAQLGYLAEKQPQVVCLQEVTPGTVNDLCSGLVEAGLVHVEHTIVDEHPRRGPRRYGLLIAATTPLRRVAVEASWPERLLGVSASLAGTACTLFTTHIPPGSSNGWAKVDMLEAVAAMAKGTAGELIVCGDFNCPREERADGTVVTWAQGIRKDRSIYIKRGYERWDAAERGILQGLPALGLRDAARTVHGAEAEMYSYFDIRKGRVCASRRYDHLFASNGLTPLDAKYDDAPRQVRLSDHGALVVDFGCMML